MGDIITGAEALESFLEDMKEKADLTERYAKLKKEKAEIESKLLKFADDVVSDASPLRVSLEEFKRLAREAEGIAAQYGWDASYTVAARVAFSRFIASANTLGKDSRWMWWGMRELTTRLIEDGRINCDDLFDVYDEYQKKVEKRYKRERGG